MTRKQAILEALKILKENEKSSYLNDIIEKLEELSLILPIVNWEEKTIFDTLDQFVLDNGRNPTTTDLKAKNMPPHPVIKHRFDMTAKEFLDKYYPKEKLCDSKIYYNKTKEEWLEVFKKEYERIKPTSSEEYNEKRKKELPSWGTVARLNGIKKYSELLKYLNLKVYRKSNLKRSSSKLKVNTYSDYDNKIDSINSKLKD